MFLFISFIILFILAIVFFIISNETNEDIWLVLGSISTFISAVGLFVSIIVFGTKASEVETFINEYNLTVSTCKMISNSEEISVNIVNKITEDINNINDRIDRNRRNIDNLGTNWYYYPEIAEMEHIEMPTFNKIVVN